MAADISYEITEHFGVFKKEKNGWTRELNKVSWNGKDAKYDIRNWDETHGKMSRGVTFDTIEIKNLYEILKTIFENESEI